MSLVSVLPWFLVLLLCTVPAAAQTPATRAEEIAQQQEEKSRNLRPYTRLWIEQYLLDVENAGGFAVARGFFVTFGDIKGGSSVALGPAYGKTFTNGTVLVAKAAYSIRNFKLVQLSAASPPLARGRLRLQGRARWQDAPVLAVYPLGPSSPRLRADYSETKTEFSGQALLTPVRFVRLGAGTGFERFDTGRAEGGSRLSVEQLFSASDMPGIGADPDYLHSFATAAFDTRTGPGYSRTGSLLEATWHDYREQNDGAFSFQRVDGIARQLIPILHGNWVIDLSLRASTTTVDANNEVPFFLLPKLGGGSDLRGYPTYRFRDRHTLLFTAEYRWYVQEFVDMAIFYDAGKVAARRSDLDFDHLKSDVGVGIRFHGPQTTIIRFDVAKSRERLRFILSFSAAVRG